MNESHIQFNSIPQWQTMSFNPIIGTEPGIYTLHTKLSFVPNTTLLFGLSNQCPIVNGVHRQYYHYLVNNTQSMWINIPNKSDHSNGFNCTNKNVSIINTNSTAQQPSINEFDTYIYIDMSRHVTIKIIYDSFEHRLQFYINDTCVSSIDLHINKDTIYPFMMCNSDHPNHITMRFM